MPELEVATTEVVLERTRADGSVNIGFVIHAGVPDVHSTVHPSAMFRPVQGVAYYAPAEHGFDCIVVRLTGPAIKQGDALGKRTHMAEYFLRELADDAIPAWLAAIMDRTRPVGALCTSNTAHPVKPDNAAWCTLAVDHDSPLHIDREGLVFTDEDADYRRPAWHPYPAADMLRIAADIVDREIQAGEHDPDEYVSTLRYRAAAVCLVHGPACDMDNDHAEPPTVNGEVI
jgi:hypothetical protein